MKSTCTQVRGILYSPLAILVDFSHAEAGKGLVSRAMAELMKQAESCKQLVQVNIDSRSSVTGSTGCWQQVGHSLKCHTCINPTLPSTRTKYTAKWIPDLRQVAKMPSAMSSHGRLSGFVPQAGIEPETFSFQAHLKICLLTAATHSCEWSFLLEATAAES